MIGDIRRIRERRTVRRALEFIGLLLLPVRYLPAVPVWDFNALVL